MPPKSARVWDIALIFCLLLLFIAICSQWRRSDGTYNLYVWQASAWLNGEASLPYKMLDVAIFKGRYYVPFPPFPSLLVLPFVALFGIKSVNTIPIAFALTGLNIASLRAIFARLELPKARASWLIAAFLGGTAYASALYLGATVWYFAHIVSVTCLLLATREALGRGRGMVIGLALGASFLSRQMTVFALLLFAVWLWERPKRLPNLLGLFLAFGVCVAIYLGYNLVRFGTPLETGYGLLDLRGGLKLKADRYGLFHPVFIPFNAFYLFLQGPSFVFRSPLSIWPTGVDRYGTSLTFASPFVFAAIWGRSPSPSLSALLRRAVWASVLLTLIPTLCYYNNGFEQWNCQRFTLDFLPLLLIPLALGVARLPEWLWRPLLFYSIALNTLCLAVLPWISH
jgi:hypothetical protein